MRKPDLAAMIAKQTDVPVQRANDVLSVILDQITNALSRNESVSLLGFGTFESRHRGARSGRNPQTGERIDISAGHSVSFRAAKALKAQLN